MRFGLLCDDLLASPVIDALSDQVGGHLLHSAVRATEQADALLHHRTAVRFEEKWEDLLVEKQIDAVLVGGSDPSILEGTKQLASAGIPILFLPHAAQGSTFAYELSLIRDDNQVTIVPLMWHRYDAAVVELKRLLREGKLGRVQFLQLNRTLHRPSTSTPISQLAVDAELLHDVDLLRWLIGDYDQITSLRTAATDDGVLKQSVVLAGRSLPEANWSICPATETDQWRLTVRGESGGVELYRDSSARQWICEFAGSRLQGDERTTALGLLDAFAGSTAQRATSEAVPQKQVAKEWGELVKCFETVDATHRSVRRRRTIELHFEPMSERAIFKTQMTAIGCSLLVATFFLTLVYLGVASFVAPSQEFMPSIAENTESGAAKTGLPFAHRLLQVLRILVFAPLGIFLVAQFLLPLTRPSSNEQTPPQES